MKNYNKLKEIIQKANPEIMELEIGCILKGYKFRSSKFWDEKFMIYKTEKGAEQFAVTGVLQKSDVNIWCNENDFEENLGRPIRLADVLLALDRHSEAIMIDADGEFYFAGEPVAQERPSMEDAKWDMRNDNLDNQSDETKQFLIDLFI